MSLTPSQLAELGLMLLARRAKSELTEESDERTALRKALLVLAALNQDDRSAAAAEFSEYVLTSFDPLVSHLDHFDHELWGGQTIGVRADEDGRPLLAIKRKTVDDLMEEFAAEERDTQRELLSRVTTVATPTRNDAKAPDPLWPRTEERFVGFYDVMGFTELVRQASDDHRDLYTVMRRLHDAVTVAEKMLVQGDQLTQTLSSLDLPSGQLKAVQFSDSIVAMTKDASPASSLLIQLASQVFFLHALHNGVIIRGAISRGIVTADFAHSLFFGQPIVDAWALEEAQCWYGIAVDRSAILQEEETIAELREDEIPITETYPVKLKGKDSPQDLQVINWPVFAETIETVAGLLRPFDGQGSRESNKLADYHQQTLAFAEAMLRKHRS